MEVIIKMEKKHLVISEELHEKIKEKAEKEGRKIEFVANELLKKEFNLLESENNNEQ